MSNAKSSPQRGKNKPVLVRAGNIAWCSNFGPMSAKFNSSTCKFWSIAHKGIEKKSVTVRWTRKIIYYAHIIE